MRNSDSKASSSASPRSLILRTRAEPDLEVLAQFFVPEQWYAVVYDKIEANDHVRLNSGQSRISAMKL
jgi:hypothetical protein